jgi:hypothetical protein
MLDQLIVGIITLLLKVKMVIGLNLMIKKYLNLILNIYRNKHLEEKMVNIFE